MYRNLLAEMTRSNISNIDIANLLKITPNSVSNKLNGKTEWTRYEICLIRRHFFPQCTIDYLFGDENGVC